MRGWFERFKAAAAVCGPPATAAPGGARHTALSVCCTSDLLSTVLCLFPLAANQVVGTRRLAASLSKTGMLRQASGGGSAAGPTNMQRRQEMLRNINTGDAVLLLGGDLNVTVVQAQVCGVCVCGGGGRAREGWQAQAGSLVKLGTAAPPHAACACACATLLTHACGPA